MTNSINWPRALLFNPLAFMVTGIATFLSVSIAILIVLSLCSTLDMLIDPSADGWGWFPCGMAILFGLCAGSFVPVVSAVSTYCPECKRILSKKRLRTEYERTGCPVGIYYCRFCGHGKDN